MGSWRNCWQLIKSKEWKGGGQRLNHMQHSSPHDTHLEDTVKSTKIHQKLGIIRVHLEPKKVISIIWYHQGDTRVKCDSKSHSVSSVINICKVILQLRNHQSLVLNCVSPLPKKYAEVLYLHYFRTWPYLEIVLYSGSQGKVASLGGWVLILHDWCSYGKEIFG